MYHKIAIILIVGLSLFTFSCSSSEKENDKKEVEKVEDETISDEEFEKEMQQLDEDVENMEIMSKGK